MRKDIKKQVKEILISKPSTRDNDNELIAIIWDSECPHYRFDDFLFNFSKGRYTSAETIRRARQKLQEQNEYLRGETYNERQRKGEEVRQTINN